MLGMSEGPVNETALGDAPRRRVRHDSTVAEDDHALGQALRQHRVAKTHDDGVPGRAPLGDPPTRLRGVRVAEVEQVN